MPRLTCRKVQDFCKVHFEDFWDAKTRQNSSPDLNPPDFAVWGALERAINKTSHVSADSVKTVIMSE